MPETSRLPPLTLTICAGSECLDRFGSILRYLVVGLVDHVARIWLVSPDPRIESFALGPTEAIVHSRLRWPLARRRIHHIVGEIGTPSPTVVHAMSAPAYAVGLALAEEYDADLVLQISSFEDAAEVERYVDAQVGRFICVSEPLARVLLQQLKIPQEHVEVIRPGVFAASRPSCFSRADRAPAIVCNAPFLRDCGVDMVIEAAHLIHKRGRRAMFFLLGHGPFESALRKQARELNVLSSVTFAHPGDPFHVMGSADIFIHPASRDSLYVDALHAMGAGLAVVSVPDAAADFLHAGQTAFVCQKASVTDLAEAIDELLKDRALAQRLAAHAQSFVRTEHSMSGMADRTAAVYRRLLLARTTFALRE